MISLKLFVVVLAHLGLLTFSDAQGDMCGSPTPDPAKTCVSIRLPWNPQPMYFCTDKSKFRYRNQCQNRFQNHCGAEGLRQDTLMVASPWDCCPMVSYPDSCVNQYCPPEPLGRKCQTIEPNPAQPWECCNSYFCEENASPEQCHFKRLEPACNMPPQGKNNCVAFIDPYGCCPKFQCEGEGRPGQCPAEAEAMKFMARLNSTVMMGPPGHPMFMGPRPGGFGPVNAGVSPAAQAEMHMEKPAEPAAAAQVQDAPAEPPAAPAPAERDNQVLGYGGPAGGPLSKGAANSAFFPGPQQNQIACIGDFNCPGTMKCCSHDINVYVTDGQYAFRNRNPTYGYCMEPAASNAKTRNDM